MNLLDDTPVVPGDTRPAFEHVNDARQILNDAEDDLREWTPELEEVHNHSTSLEPNLMPVVPSVAESDAGTVTTTGGAVEGSHIAHHNGFESSAASVTTGGVTESEAGLIRE